MKKREHLENTAEQEALAAQLGESDTFIDKMKRMSADNKLAVFSAFVILFFLLLAVCAPLLTPYSFEDQDLLSRLSAPSAKHLLGTDELGRDVLTRLLYGARVSLAVGIIPTIASMVIGVLLGMISGYVGGIVDAVIMRLADVVLSFPSLLLAMVIMYTLGDGITSIFIALAITSWAGVARVIRSETLTLRETEYVEAAGEKGTKYWTSVDTGGTDWLWLAMAEYGDDWTGGFKDKANVKLDSVKNMLTMQQRWLKNQVAEVSPDGHVDLEAGFQNILDHNIVSFPKAMWYMSRFTNYMSEEKGNWYIAKCPVFEEGQKCSVGIGGTGTVVTQQSKSQDLAAEFLCWAKMSEVGEQNIWDTLGFDVCNTDCWTLDSFAKDENNQYNQFFINKPYDVLNSIGLDNIGKISSVAISPTINEYTCNTTLNEVLEDPDYSVDDALQELQDAVDAEQN